MTNLDTTGIINGIFTDTHFNIVNISIALHFRICNYRNIKILNMNRSKKKSGRAMINHVSMHDGFKSKKNIEGIKKK